MSLHDIELKKRNNKTGYVNTPYNASGTYKLRRMHCALVYGGKRCLWGYA
jgi:hypothetical protein